MEFPLASNGDARGGGVFSLDIGKEAKRQFKFSETQLTALGRMRECGSLQ